MTTAVTTLRSQALEAALEQLVAADRKSHETNYETLYVGRDGDVYWSESINSSDRQYYRDEPGMVFVEQLLQVGTGSCSCNCDYCLAVGQPDGYETSEDAIDAAVLNGDTEYYESAIRAKLNDAGDVYDRISGQMGIPIGYFQDEQENEA